MKSIVNSIIQAPRRKFVDEGKLRKVKTCKFVCIPNSLSIIINLYAPNMFPWLENLIPFWIPNHIMLYVSHAMRKFIIHNYKFVQITVKILGVPWVAIVSFYIQMFARKDAVQKPVMIHYFVLFAWNQVYFLGFFLIFYLCFIYCQWNFCLIFIVYPENVFFVGWYYWPSIHWLVFVV